ncbi:MAG: (S)-sulfolactate dehydrogenase [Thermoplasmata archaeon]|nr:(S)-sulfolactate dehydrogenase [Thermoplasmata archaeon]
MTVLVTSVPREERALAEASLPGARIVAAPLGPSMGERGVRVLCVSYADRVTRDTLAAFPDLEAVVTRSDGFDHLPLADVACYHLGDYAADPVASLAVTFLMMLARRVPEAAARTRAGSWRRDGLVSRELDELRVGVLGAGRIGERVLRQLAELGVDAWAYDIKPRPGFRMAESLDALLEGSDALSVHVPLDAATRGMIGARELALLRAPALLVNTSRGAVVDQAAVAEALRAGRLAGYAADVLPGEPEPAEDLARFAGLDNVVLTPHVAAYDRRTVRERYQRTGRIVAALLRGEGGRVESLRVS